MKKYILYLFLFIGIGWTQHVSAQGENNVWCFGARAGLNFNSNPPGSFVHSMSVFEGCSAVSDANGALLFYTLGSRMWDRNNVLMPGSNTLLGNGPLLNGVPFGSAAGGVIIIKSPNNDGKYFVFCLNAKEEGLDNLYYAVVDMNLNGGLGDIPAGQSSIFLGAGYSEIMSAFKGADCHSFWVVARTKTAPQQYHAYKVDFNGVHTTPVVSGSSNTTTTRQGLIEVAPDGVTMAMPVDQGVEIATFNGLSGTIGNFMLLDNPNGAYYTAFSPDQSKLYLSGNSILQLDYTLMPNTTAVNNSAIQVGDSLRYSAMRLGPDNKIYLQRSTTASGTGTLTPPILAVINSPNLSGSACDIDTFLMQFLPLTDIPVFTGFGAPVPIHPPGITTTSVQSEAVCFQSTTIITANNTGATSYVWNNGGSGASITVNQDGRYWVRYNIGCDLFVDSFDVTLGNFDLSLGNDTTICEQSSLVLNPGISGAAYEWQDGSTTNTYTVTAAGTYYVKASIGSCSLSDTIVVTTEPPLNLQIAERDTLICMGTSLDLHASVSPGSAITWNTGATGNSITVNTAGTYTARAGNSCGLVEDRVNIGIIDLNLWLGADTVLCEGGSIMLNPGVPGAAYEWQDGSTNSVYTVTAPGTYYVTAAVQQCVKSDTIVVQQIALPYVAIREADSSICKGTHLILHALHEHSQDISWSTGDTKDSITVNQAGTYTVSASSQCGTISASIDIDLKDCSCQLFAPNAFTPNNDNHNDVFRIRLECPVTGYELSVFNRYGNEVYRSNNINEGWNGTYKGRTCDVGVYYYMVSVRDMLGNTIFKKGDVTLIR